ncbi:MAG: dienelactone hydrolase family protein [Nitrososphaerales archaeon]
MSSKQGSELKELISIKAGPVQLEGMLEIPKDAKGVVIFAHGSGSSRHSKRNKYVASVLRASGIGTLLFDLLTVKEAEDRANVFDIDLLAQRLLYATEWIRNNTKTKNLPIGYFGASTGAAAALKAAIITPVNIRAIVSRGGRPDMIGPALQKVKPSTLLIVGGNDFGVLELNMDAYNNLRCEKEMKIIPGTTHLFEEPGALEEVARIASEWFLKHFEKK